MPIRPVECFDFTEIDKFKEEMQGGSKKTTSKNTWKSFERLVSVDFNTTRTPLSGMVKTITNSDTLHPKIYVECKLRGGDKDFSFWGLFQELRKKSGDKIVGLVIQDVKTNLKIVLLHRKDFLKFKKDAIFEPSLINLVELPKFYKSVLSLYNQTVQRAEIESKIPVVALKKKNMKGYLVGTSLSSFEKLFKILK